MKSGKGKWWLAVIAVCCLTPAAFADWGHHHHGCDGQSQREDCQGAPEGGSTAIYLLGAGLTCFGAMFVRSRIAKSTQS
jgi:hypothetical protein